MDVLEASQRSIGLDPGRENQRTDSVADAFVDNHVDYAYIAERIRPYDLKIVENIARRKSVARIIALHG